MTARGMAETCCGCDSYPSVLPVIIAGTVLYGWKGGLRVLWKTETREWGTGEKYITRSFVMCTAHQIL